MSLLLCASDFPLRCSFCKICPLQCGELVTHPGAIGEDAVSGSLDDIWLAVFYLCQWFLWNFTADDANGAHHTAKLIAANGLALMGSVLVFFPMVVGHLLKRSSWMTSPTFVNIASLILAFSWETAVYTAVQGASETVEGETMQKVLAMIDLVIILVVILPGWYIYMLPSARAEAKEEAKNADAAAEDKPPEAAT